MEICIKELRNREKSTCGWTQQAAKQHKALTSPQWDSRQNKKLVGWDKDI